MTKEAFESKLIDFVPQRSADILTNWIFEHKIALTITRERKTKLGDFKTKGKNKQLKISVNANLNSYAFLITLVHEIAHAIVFKEYGHRTKPHGAEWKTQYKQLMLIFFARNIFPDDLARPLAAYMKNPKASSHSDIRLLKALQKYDNSNKSIIRLEDLREGDHFVLNKRSFIKGQKRRTRYSCIEVKTKREYAVSGMAEVEYLNK